MAGTQYIITLSDDKATYPGDAPLVENGRFMGTQEKDFNVKEQEVQLLGGLLSSAKPKKSSELVLRLETQARLEDTEHGKHILFDQQEMDWLNEGLKEMLDKSNRGWIFCRNVLKQVVRPVEYKPEEKESKEAPSEETKKVVVPAENKKESIPA